MEIKKGQTVYVTRENKNIQNTPTSGTVHSIHPNHVVLKTVGGTGLYKAHKNNISHDKDESWLRKKYQYEDTGSAPTNNAGSGNVQGIGTGPKGEPGVSPSAMSRYKKKNQAGAPSPLLQSTARRKTLSDFIKGN